MALHKSAIQARMSPSMPAAVTCHHHYYTHDTITQARSLHKRNATSALREERIWRYCRIFFSHSRACKVVYIGEHARIARDANMQ